MSPCLKIGFLGAGKMAQAMARGFISAGAHLARNDSFTLWLLRNLSYEMSYVESEITYEGLNEIGQLHVWLKIDAFAQIQLIDKRQWRRDTEMQENTLFSAKMTASILGFESLSEDY